MTDPIIKTLIVKSRGRKFFQCVIGGYDAKLVINEVSQDLGVDRVVKMQVNDLSERSKYGVVLKFEPVAIIEDRDAEQLRLAAQARKDAEKWLGYAEADVKRGLSRTGAIEKAVAACEGQDHLVERLTALKAHVQQNVKAYEAQKQATRAAHAARRSMRVLYPASMTPSMGVPVRIRGNEIVVFESVGKTFRIDDSHPSYEGGHLLGHEGEAGRYCYYRQATPDEVSQLEADEAAIQSKAEAQAKKEAALSLIKAEIMEKGECPAGFHHVVGETVLSTQDAYGGGDWFVITDADIWYVRNNGLDGDDWSLNNVATGGAGAVGYRVARTSQLEQQIRDLSNV